MTIPWQRPCITDAPPVDDLISYSAGCTVAQRQRYPWPFPSRTDGSKFVVFSGGCAAKAFGATVAVLPGHHLARHVLMEW